MIRRLRFLLPTTAYRLVYMLQQLEYDPSKLWAWLLSIPDMKTVVKRGKLVLTTKAKVLLGFTYLVYGTVIMFGVAAIVSDQIFLGLLLLVLAMDCSAMALLAVAYVGEHALRLKRAPVMKKAEEIFQTHTAVRIAVLGSYGKTTMKELLHTVLSEKFNVAMTPGNKNVPISHARWSQALTGDEDVLVIEYGEGEPGDIRRLASLSHPTMAVMTGVAPNHLDYYKTLVAVEEDLASIEQFVSRDALYVNADAKGVIEKLAHRARLYSNTEVNGWKIADKKVVIEGTLFTMKRGATTLKLRSGLLGEHNIGPLAAVASIAYDMGLTKSEIEAGVEKTKPFEHRMQARNLHGAWLIDDTYNGNLEGFKAGLNLLAKLEAKRKIYVTPGLVDQGEETERVHFEIGKAIAKAAPDRVVLMQNANTDFIKTGMDDGEFMGELIIETDPLSFYNGIEQFVAAGDIVLMQNDLPDAYS